MFALSSVLKTHFVWLSILLFSIGIFCSCGTTRPFVYMQGQFDTVELSKVKITDPVIQKGDMISIIVYSDNPEATRLFNQPLITVAGSTGVTGSAGGGGNEGIQQSLGASPSAPGYLVDENGNIEFQALGLLHVEGQTREGLKKLLDSKLKDTLLTNPYYIIRFLNNRFTILGEVSKPGIYTIPSEHINILEALGLAGDMTYFGRRDNILVIREQNTKREFARLDITKPEIMSSPYFYLQQNDVIIIEQNRKKSVANDQVTTRNIGIATSVISVVAIIFTLAHY